MPLSESLGSKSRAMFLAVFAAVAILVLIGAALGVLAAGPLLNLFIALLPDEVVLLKAARIDWRVAGFVAATMACLCGLVSVAPIHRSFRPDAGGVKGGTSDRARTPARFIAVGRQLAAAFVLTVVGACLVGSLLSVYATERSADAEFPATKRGHRFGQDVDAYHG